jgi:hypothetical protein
MSLLIEQYFPHALATKLSLKTGENRAGGVPQAIQHLPSKHKALSSKSSTAKKKKKGKNHLGKTQYLCV